MPPTLEQAKTMIDAIEAELHQAGFWQETPLPPEAYQFKAAFAMDTMAYTQWLQFIFIPRVRTIIETRGNLPARSQVGVQAVREFDGVPQADGLQALLSEFDALFES
jgi:uncharacterized protein YqcC (DUF446 family)